ncbi:MAG: peptidylprolyl isomerase [Ignavibacteriales bacterium]|nr:peptidylprolyl isomerase [Ignavibacteriales bacterium]
MKLGVLLVVVVGITVCQIPKGQVKKKSETSKRKSMIAVLETNVGTIEIELFEHDAPKTVKNFAGLAEQGYYNGIIFHRVVHGFVIQGGDSTGTGTGGRSIYGSGFEDELNPNAPSYQEGYKHGTVAMANRGPNTNTSQFFICLGDLPLPKAYTIFGKVAKGLDVVDLIGKTKTGPMDRPEAKVVMNKVYVKKPQ